MSNNMYDESYLTRGVAMKNQSGPPTKPVSGESAEATYLKKFDDVLELIPNKVQREVSQIQHDHIEYRGLLEKMEDAVANLKTVNQADEAAVKNLMFELQNQLIAGQKNADVKLGAMQSIMDTVEEKRIALDQDLKKLEEAARTEVSGRENAEKGGKRGSRRSARSETVSSSAFAASVASTINTMVAGSAAQAASVESASVAVQEACAAKTQHSSKASSSKTIVQKKVAKKKKRKQRERSSSPQDMAIDPDEPTYCLCEQVSYGEMIGCDNDLCPIEWFHFSCVNLTHKPRGKWYCPKCRGDRPTVMKPRAQFLRELEKYNKEKEEKL